MMKKTVQLSNGEELAYTERSPGHETTVLLIHGNMSSGLHYLPLINRLENEYHVLAPDMRGFGDSTYETPLESLADLAEDIAEFMETLEIEKAYVVGWSTGGGVALKLAALHPDKVEKVALLESCSYRGYPIFEKDESMQPLYDKLYQSKEEMAKDPVQVLPVLKALEDKNKDFMKQIWSQLIWNVGLPDEENADLYLEETLKQRNLVDIDWALLTFNMSHASNGVSEGDGTIDNVKAPVLNIHGMKDAVIPKTMFDENNEILKDVTPKIYEDAGHSPITDIPEKLAEDLKAFFRG